MNINPLFATDFYKTGHIRQYPEGTEYVYSNFTCRSDRNFKGSALFDHKVVFFGLQGIIRWMLIDLWNKQFFWRPKKEVLEEYQRMMDRCLGPGAVDTKHFADLHDLGYLPIKIKALPEGARVDIRVPLLTIVNTDPRFFWLTNYLETQLSAELWKPITSATTAYEYRRLFEAYAKQAESDRGIIPFQGHDFSMRGMSGIHDATQSGAAHLTSFVGTDTISAVQYLQDHYAACLEPIVGCSVPATEHSVMCMGGQIDEFETFRRLICDVYPKGIVSIVSDTWDFWKVITEFLPRLKKEILARDGRVVIRPDSGDPVKIIVGDPEEAVDTPQFKGAIQCMWEVFGGTYTPMGRKVLDSHIGLIYGDSISLERADQILRGLQAQRFAPSNVVLGIGSYTYQYVTRDTLGTAIKATWGQVEDYPRELCKDPKTDDGTKRSAKGLLRVEFENGHYVVYDQQHPKQEQQGALVTVFHDGLLGRQYTLGEIRERLWPTSGKGRSEPPAAETAQSAPGLSAPQK